MKNLLIVGGSGALGRSVISHFKKSTPLWKVFNIDFKSNDLADNNYKIQSGLNQNELGLISANLWKNRLDCIINTAGGWEGSSLSDDNIIDSLNNMMKMNLNSTVLSAYLAKKYLNENSLVVFTGANAVKSQMNPGMLSYHLAKQSVHHLAELLSSTNELPKGAKVITILP
jgi:NAD(P)-dependent dehydrogenase (short-subunit alcohol dehydrogenase family)